MLDAGGRPELRAACIASPERTSPRKNALDGDRIVCAQAVGRSQRGAERPLDDRPDRPVDRLDAERVGDDPVGAGR